VAIGGRTLIDGGFVNPVPFDVVRDRADLVVAVDVTGRPQHRPGTPGPRTLDTITGATQILFHTVIREKLARCPPHILIRPDVGTFGAMDYFKFREIFAAADPAKEDLKRKLSQMLASAG
jgi:NTE family protein